eukprot:1160179-Pelagomonas_calceolata.AAC.14
MPTSLAYFTSWSKKATFFTTGCAELISGAKKDSTVRRTMAAEGGFEGLPSSMPDVLPERQLTDDGGGGKAQHLRPRPNSAGRQAGWVSDAGPTHPSDASHFCAWQKKANQNFLDVANMET